MVKEFIFDKWSDLYSERASLMKSSAVRDLFIVASRPDIISLAGGMPCTSYYDYEEIVDVVRHMMKKEGSAALQYGSSEGHIGLKELIADFLNEEGIKVDIDEMIITDGAQQGLELLGKIFINAGDKILVEGPTYVGAIQAFGSYQADFVSIPLDNDGLDVEKLEQKLEEMKRNKERAKFLYIVPNFHNPAGVTLAQRRREKILELSKEYNLLIIEDNPYGRVRFEGEDIPSLRSKDENVILLGTFSKMFSPGFRLGWVIAPLPIIEKLNYAKQAANLCSSSFTQRCVEEYLAHHPWRMHLHNLIDIYRGRRDAMLKALTEFFPEDSSWTEPNGGLFVWATLPRFIDTTEMLAEAINEKVAYVPGKAFYPNDQGQNCMRLNFSYPEEDQIHEGIKRLSRVIKQYTSIYRSLMRKTSSSKANTPTGKPERSDQTKETKK